MANFPKTAELRVTARTATGVWCELNYDDPAATYTIPVKKGQAVIYGATNVLTAFDATTPTITIGDGSDADGYADNTDVALATARTATTPAFKPFSGLGQPYANGKLYTADDTIDVAWNPGTGGTAGKLLIYIEFASAPSHDGITVA